MSGSLLLCENLFDNKKVFFLDVLMMVIMIIIRSVSVHMNDLS